MKDRPGPAPGPAPTLTTAKIVFLVVAAVAPMAAVVGTVPLAFALGTGSGVPAAYALAGVVLLCFAAGYAAMGRHIVSTGGFYAYLRHGLGRVPAVCGAFVAALAYNAFTCGLIGACAYFTRLALQDLAHITVPWPLLAAVVLLLVALLGRRQIDLSARMLALLLGAEMAVLAVLDVAITAHKGASAFPATSFSPHTATHGALGVTLMFAFISFLGFESAALYGEEARDPKRSVPRAVYASVVLIAVFYGLTSWIAVGGIGPDHLRERSGTELGSLFFSLNTQYVAQWVTKVMEVAMCTSLFASTLSVHNACSRYMYALGRDRVLPVALGTPHRRTAAPSAASLLQVLLDAVVVAAFAAAGLHPYLNLATSMLGLGTVGIIALQAAAALSIVVYFRRHRAIGHWWTGLVAPLLGAAGLLAALVLVLRNFTTLSGTSSAVVHALPWLLLVAVAAGAWRAAWMRSRAVTAYDRLAATDAAGERNAAMEPARPAAGALDGLSA
ncbi:APC family permease [Streptomyces caeni]|uniref:APC family permease n=1 Tax=Streptomyces caeni TaxID=2307231 RepID=A0ABW4IUD2_9ACTN